MKDRKIKVKQIKLDSTVGEVIDKLVEESVESIVMRADFQASTKVFTMIINIFLEVEKSQDETVAAIKALKEPAANIIKEEYAKIERFVRSFGEDENYAEHAKHGLILFTNSVNKSCLDLTKKLAKEGKRGDISWFFEAAQEVFAEKKV
jgi:hypothetical protein